MDLAAHMENVRNVYTVLVGIEVKCKVLVVLN
jgi:hypothetical protein